MSLLKKSSLALLIGLFFLTACASADNSASIPTATLPPTLPPTPTGVFPTPSAPGNAILWDGLQVTMDQLEITQEFINEYGSTRVPPAGKKFLWVHIQLKNTGQIEMVIPIAGHFSVLYAATEIKPTYGHRQGYAEYTTLGTLIFPNQGMDGWLQFDIPATAELKDLRFVFLPESSEVGASFTSPNYPYAEDKPTFVWNCGS